jgi:hypothetical protein
MLSKNPNAISLLEANLDKIDWFLLSTNPGAITLIEKNLDKVNWLLLSENPAAIHILEANQDKIDWRILSENYEIFEYDYESMKQTRPFTEELMANRFHPNNLDKFEDWGF